MATTKEYRYPLRMPAADSKAVAEVVKTTGHSINSVLLLAVRKGLPLARQTLSAEQGRVTNVDPLPGPVLDRIHRQPDRDEAGEQRLMKAQATGEARD